MAFLAAVSVGVITFVLVLNARTIMTVTMVNRLELSEQAHLQAESVLAMARARLAADRNFGKNGESVLLGVTEPNGIWAEVSFAAGAPFRSQNNLGEETRKFGLGGIVLDPGMCQIVAVSYCRSKRVVAYEVVTGPPLPFSLGASGSLVAGGSTLIGAVENAAVLADGLQDSDVVEGGVVANGSSTALPDGVPATLTLRDEVRVIGDAQTTGTAQVASTVRIERGQVKQGEERADLPRINIADYDPAGKEGVVRHDGAASVSEGGPLYGFHRYTPASAGGVVTFTGDVDLQGALVYVDGDVVLDKPLKGTGALVATGSVTLRGGADMEADSLAAVLAGEDLTVTGAAGTRTQFTGLLYTEGNLSLSNTRVVGAALANGDGAVGQGSTMSIMDSEVLASPEGQDVAIVIQDFADPRPGGREGDAAEVSSILKPIASDLFVEGEFNTDELFIRSLIKIRHEGVTYDSPGALPLDHTSQEWINLDAAFENAVMLTIQKANLLKTQHEAKPVEIVRFDLNEFLNVSDRLRSSRTFYIEG